MLPSYRNEKSQSVKVLCCSLKNLSHRNEFFICSGLVFLFYLVYGYFAELIFTYHGVSGWYITLIQFFYYALFGLRENAKCFRQVPLKLYILLAFLTLGTMVCRTWLNKQWTIINKLFFYTGIIKLLIGIFKLSNANHL